MPGQAPAPLQCWYAKTRNFVMAGLTKNPPLNEAFSKADSKANYQYEWEKRATAGARRSGLS
jgi:hypothetical protein